MVKNEGKILNWLVLLEIQEKYSMMRRNITLIIPAVSLQEAEEKAKKYWKGYEKENVRQRIVPMIIGQEMQLDNFLEMSIPNNPDLDASWINKYQMCLKPPTVKTVGFQYRSIVEDSSFTAAGKPLQI